MPNTCGSGPGTATPHVESSAVFTGMRAISGREDFHLRNSPQHLPVEGCSHPLDQAREVPCSLLPLPPIMTGRWRGTGELMMRPAERSRSCGALDASSFL